MNTRNGISLSPTHSEPRGSFSLLDTTSAINLAWSRMSIPKQPAPITERMKPTNMSNMGKTIMANGHEDPGHSHGTYGNELFFVLGTKAIPYVTPSLLFVCDLNHTPGSYLQMRVDAAIPVVRRAFLLEPYLLLGLNLGYNTTAYYGWNHFQFGLKASWEVSRFISIYGGISYSVAMTALRQIDQQNEVWASAGMTFSY